LKNLGKALVIQGFIHKKQAYLGTTNINKNGHFAAVWQPDAQSYKQPV
jgi:hypothetical protein